MAKATCWFEKAMNGPRNSADPLYMKVTHGRPELRRVRRAIESWNRIPATVNRKLRAPPMQPAAMRAEL
jgi:hypothetical protein